MKRWALVTIVLYLLLLVALTVPLIAAMTWDGSGGGNMSKGSLWASVAEALGSAEEAYEEIWYWILLGILGACQGLLFIVPIRDVLKRPIKKRHLLPTVVTGAFLIAALMALLTVCIYLAAFGENNPPGNESWWGWGLLAGGLGMWALWFFIFRAFYRSADGPRQWMREVTMYLYIGSILELIVAVNAHVVCRKRGDCCAPVVTGFGIAAGVAVALMSFGPGVFYLFADRKRRITARAVSDTAKLP